MHPLFTPQPGDMVLDPFLGSGATALAANELGRNSIGIEIQPEYYESTIARFQQAKNKQLSL